VVIPNIEANRKCDAVVPEADVPEVGLVADAATGSLEAVLPVPAEIFGNSKTHHSHNFHRPGSV